MSIKVLNRRHVKVQEQILSSSAIIVRFESSQYFLSTKEEVLQAIQSYKSAKIECRSNAGGVYQLTVMLNSGYKYHSFASMEKARDALPSRLFQGDQFKHKVSNVLITDSEDESLFEVDTELSISAFESKCFTRALYNGKKITEVCVLVMFSNGHEQSFCLSLSTLADNSCLSLSDHIAKRVEELGYDDTFELYEEDDDLNTYYFLLNFNQQYKLEHSNG